MAENVCTGKTPLLRPAGDTVMTSMAGDSKWQHGKGLVMTLMIIGEGLVMGQVMAWKWPCQPKWQQMTTLRGSSWWTGEDPKKFDDDIWWHLMTFDDMWWHMMTFDDIWWPQLAILLLKSKVVFLAEQQKHVCCRNMWHYVPFLWSPDPWSGDIMSLVFFHEESFGEVGEAVQYRLL
jgi:hypothetical protein